MCSANLEHANLDGAKLANSDLLGVKLGLATWTNATEWPDAVADIVKTRSVAEGTYFRIEPDTVLLFGS